MIQAIEKRIRQKWFWGFFSCVFLFLYSGCGFQDIEFPRFQKMVADFCKYDRLDQGFFLLQSYAITIFNFSFFGWSCFYFPYVLKGTKFLTVTTFLNFLYSLYWCVLFFKTPGITLSLTAFAFTLQGYYSVELLLVNLLHKLTARNQILKAEKILNYLKKRYPRYC